MSASGKSVIFSKCNYFWLLLRFIMVTIVHYIKKHFKKRAKLVIIYVRTFCKHLAPQWSSIITRKIASKNSTKSWFQALIDLDYHDFPCQITVIMVKWGHFYSVLTLEKIPSHVYQEPTVLCTNSKYLSSSRSRHWNSVMKVLLAEIKAQSCPF